MPYKFKDLMKIIEKDGWYIVRQRGSHKQYKHNIKTGTVTIACHNINDEALAVTASSILKQAKLKD